MLPSLAQLQKVLQTEVGLKYANKAVIGGLPKLMTFWEPNARRDGLSDEFIKDVASRLRTYVETDLERRPAALGEILDAIKAEDAKRAAAERRPEPTRPTSTPARPREQAPRRDEPRREGSADRPRDANSGQRQRTDAPDRGERPAQNEPRREPRPERGQRTDRPQEGRPAQERRDRPEREPRPERGPRTEQDAHPELRGRLDQGTDTVPLQGGAPEPIGEQPQAEARPKPQPRPQPQPKAKPKPQPQPQQGGGESRRRFEGASMSVEPVDPKPRQGQGPRPLRAADPVDPNAALEAPLTVLRGVGPETAKDFERLGLSTLGDLLHYYPRRYDNYARMKTINRLQYGEECTLIATVSDMRERKFKGNRTMLQVTLTDGTGTVEVTEFNPYRKQLLTPGRQVVVSGKVDQYLGRLTIKPREWEKLDVELLNTGRIVPVYGLTEGLYQRGLRNLTAQVANFWARRQSDPLPAEIVSRAALMNYGEALAQIHFPDNETKLADAQHRLAFDELFALQIGVLRQRRDWQATPAQPLSISDAGLDAFLGSLPYPLTGAQKRVVGEIRADLAGSTPMNRLLQGDVGSGKTIVAATAMAIAVGAGAQAALMAPTSILAEQHYRTLLKLFAPPADPAVDDGSTPTAPVRLLQGSTPAAEKAEIYAGLRDGSIKMIVGTHALIEDPVEFANLGVAVIDEQHRFGVAQRAALRSKGRSTDGTAVSPHLLVMTATPIPRTLALTVFGDLDLSLLDEMPPGRQPIMTYLLHANERERGYAFVRREVNKGRQAYLIFPLVEESEKIEARAAVEEHARLQKEIFPEFKLGLLHGRMKPDEKDAVMAAFKANETQILVSTSVVEVGVDVPNATVILIDGANRFGLSQLHQFRGRVGRGEHASYCLLTSDSPDPTPDERLQAMEQTQDGFVLAEKDLEMRGPGDFLGTRQAGFASLQAAGLSDIATIEKARREARAVFEADPELESPEHAGIRQLVAAFWQTGSGDVS